jgi:cytochrome c oxidase assembly protein subunit 11
VSDPRQHEERSDADVTRPVDRRTAGGAQGTVLRLLVGVGAMFAFAFALVPLYDAICEVTGLNGKTGGPYTYQAAEPAVDRERDVRIRFLANNSANMVWEFRPTNGALDINPGAVNTAVFYARNPSDHTIVGQAIPSVAPARAAEFFHKTECFCFENQVLGPGEEIEMPVRFIVDRDLPGTVKSISLSYTLYDVTERVGVPADRTSGD